MTCFPASTFPITGSDISFRAHHSSFLRLGLGHERPRPPASERAAKSLLELCHCLLLFYPRISFLRMVLVWVSGSFVKDGITIQCSFSVLQNMDLLFLIYFFVSSVIVYLWTFVCVLMCVLPLFLLLEDWVRDCRCSAFWENDQDPLIIWYRTWFLMHAWRN